MADFDWTSLIAPAVGAGASLWAGNQGANAAQGVGNTLTAGGNQAADALQPYIQQGQRAASLLGNEDITKLPGYDSGMQAMEGARNRANAARGQFYSGNALRQAQTDALGYNAQKTAERQNQLTQLLGVGQNAANSLGNIRMGQANAQGASQVGQYNSQNSGLTNALDLASKYLTSKDSKGNTGAQNVGSGLSALLSGGKSLYDNWGGGSGGGSTNYYEDKPTFAGESGGFSDWGFD